MAPASFSGRLSEDRSFSLSHSAFQRSTVILPKRHGVRRIAYRQSSVSCNALALGSVLDWPVLKPLSRLLGLRQVEQVRSEYVSTSQTESAGTQSWRNLKDVSLSAVHIGLSLTAAALNLASRVILDLQIRARELRAQKAENNKKAVARQKVMDAQTQLQYEIQRQRLEVQGKDKAFVSMLHVLDRCHLDHDVKWALVQKHTADKAEFSERLQQLYNLAEKSKGAVDHLLRPDASRKEINTFWKSPETVAIIAEEDKLKSLVFAQMLQASA